VITTWIELSKDGSRVVYHQKRNGETVWHPSESCSECSLCIKRRSLNVRAK